MSKVDMSTPHPKALLHRILALVRARRLDRELDDEIAAHLELAERDAIAAGLSREEARRTARRQFGGIDQMKEVHRDGRSVRWIETLLKDIRYGIVTLSRDPVFACVAIGVLALGIGANTAMFSVMDAVLLKPLPYPEPERIVRVWEAPPPNNINPATTQNFLEWKRRSTVFDALSGESLITMTAAIGVEPVRLTGRLVSADHFSVFGIEARIGRTFAPHEDQPGAAPVVVLSHAAWQARFAGAADILTRDIILDGQPHRIVGVLPAGSFDREVARAGEDAASFWKPHVFTREQLTSGNHWLNVVGRLRAGVTLARAQEDMLAVRAGQAPGYPQFKKDWSVRVEPFSAQLVTDVLRRMVYVAFGAVVLVLLIACANVVNLLLSKSVAREQEMAVRAALGASRGRLVAQLLTETFVLCLAGGGAGLLVAALLIQAATPALRLAMPSTPDLTLDLRVFGFAFAVALGSAMLVGLLPSLRASTGHIAPLINLASRGSSRGHGGLRRAIVVGEVATSVVLICAALLLVKSLMKLHRVDLGFRVDNVIAMSIDLPAAAYPTAERATQFFTAIVERLAVAPGIERAALTRDLPLDGSGGEYLLVPGSPERLLVRFKRIDSSYFDALDIPVLSGRGIADSDRAGAPRVVVINQELARHLSERFGMTDPIGHTVNLAAPHFQFGSGRADMRIVGIIRSERVRRDLRVPIEDVAYVPLAQAPPRDVKLIVHTQGEPSSIVAGVRAALRDVDPRVALAEVRTLDQLKRRSLSGSTEPAWAIATFAGLSAFLAALGLYGVLSHLVAQQRREIGIRMALGARARDVLSHVLRNALTMVGVGLALGIAGAAVLTRVTTSLLFEVSALDPVAFAAAAGSMALIGLIAALVPASRAARVDPSTVLRSEG